MEMLRLSAAVAMLSCAVALWWQARRALAAGRPRIEAPPKGSASAGVLYAFGVGMSPWAKESGREHLVVWLTGVMFHLGIFAALALSVIAVGGWQWPMGLARVVAPLVAAALVAGIGLLVRRLRDPNLRAISSPDDYASNILVGLLLASALVSTALGTGTASMLFVATVVFLYAPLGKIRHCVFFFLARLGFGRLVGRRGILPHAAGGARP